MSKDTKDTKAQIVITKQDAQDLLKLLVRVEGIKLGEINRVGELIDKLNRLAGVEPKDST